MQTDYIQNLKAVLPQQLVDTKQFLLWRSMPDHAPSGKPRKVPFYATGKPRSGKLDTPEDVANLVDLDTAAAAIASGKYSGIGVAVLPGSGVAGLDLDDCIDGDGHLTPQADRIVDAARESGCYVERSPSRRGLRILGQSGGFAVIKSAGLEAYSEKRYLTLTGDVLYNPQGWGDLTPAYNEMKAVISSSADVERLPTSVTGLFDLNDDLGALTHPIRAGERNHRLFSIACGVRNSGGGFDKVLAEITAVNSDLSRMVDGPVDDTELEQIANSAMRYSPGRVATETVTGGSPLNDTGNAERLVKFAKSQGIHLRYVVERKTWLIWHPRRKQWAWDTKGLVIEIAKKAMASIYSEAKVAAASGDSAQATAISKHASHSLQLFRLQAAITLAQSMPGVATTYDELNADDWLIGLENGVIDLRTGTFREAEPDDLITMRLRTVYDPAAECPVWCGLWTWAMSDDDAMVSFIQQALGIVLTGDRSLQAFMYWYGYGMNGKSTLLNAFRELMGGYATVVQPETFTVSKQGRSAGSASPDLAKLAGKRFAAATELEDGQVLAESLVKQVTGGDAMSARFLHANEFEFTPKFLLTMAANHLPIVKGTDHGIWRRILLVPFDRTITADQCDPDLPSKLRAEFPGIFNWLLVGLNQWLRAGKKLHVPAKVQAATGRFRAESDVAGRWISDRCTVGFDKAVESSRAYADFQLWCEMNGFRPYTKTRFTRTLLERGITVQRRSGGRGQDYIGITI